MPLLEKARLAMFSRLTAVERHFVKYYFDQNNQPNLILLRLISSAHNDNHIKQIISYQTTNYPTIIQYQKPYCKCNNVDSSIGAGEVSVRNSVFIH